MSKSVLVIGGGPGGASAAYWLAKNGLDVHLVEKKTYPREKACGDGLTPRAIKQLLDMGFDFDGLDLHRVDGLRAYAGDLRIELPWPEHSVYPNWGATMRRADLDGVVATMAEKQGAIVEQGVTASPIVDNDTVTGVKLVSDGAERTVTPDLVVIADGSNSRFGRGVGASRRKDFPFGLAVRAYYESPNSDDSFIESQLDIRDQEGRAMPGYGWVFPLGDGEINVGAGLVSTFKGWKDINTSRILDAYIGSLPEHWEVVEATSHTKPIGGKLPMSFSVGPKIGRNWARQPIQRRGHRLRVRNRPHGCAAHRRRRGRRRRRIVKIRAGARGHVRRLPPRREGVCQGDRQSDDHADTHHRGAAVQAAHGVDPQSDGQPA